MGFVHEWITVGPRPSRPGKSPTLVGVWEQVGMLHRTSGVPVPWPEGSPNASVREFFAFFEDGTFRFARFFAGANVRFDEGSREFVSDEEAESGLSGTWRLFGTVLTEEYTNRDGQPARQSVQLGSITDEQFVIEEKTPIPGFVLSVVYRRFRGKG
jgi:hypothetical protein